MTAYSLLEPVPACDAAEDFYGGLGAELIDPRGNSGLTDNKRLREEGLGCLWSVISEDMSFDLNIWEVSQNLVPAKRSAKSCTRLAAKKGDRGFGFPAQ